MPTLCQNPRATVNNTNWSIAIFKNFQTNSSALKAPREPSVSIPFPSSCGAPLSVSPADVLLPVSAVAGAPHVDVAAVHAGPDTHNGGYGYRH